MKFTRRLATLAVAAALFGTSLFAHAEGRIRIAEQFGIVYLLLNVAQQQKLIEKHGKAQGLDVQVEFVRLSGGSAVNDALLSGQIDIAGAGVGPLLTIWDRTRDRQNVRGVASLGNFPYYLVSINPAVKTIADFTEKDRIATPAVGVSVQSRVLQLASAKLWGDANFNRLDKLQVALPHPEATAAKFIAAQPEAAADIFLKSGGGGGADRALVLSIIKDPAVQFKLAPQNTLALAEFMHRVGAIKNKPASARDYFFDDAHNAGGS
jgi:ABC-type nitrate/sulfonate/bicarbonate transport system substrate-binding protein